jgi:hypothetical protein
LDLSLLSRALSSFSSLRQIKLLRVQDKADESILDLLGELDSEPELILDWNIACSRAVRNLGIALLQSGRHSVRFIGPQISPEATSGLLKTPRPTIAAIGVRLTCLDVSFHATDDITAVIESLSEVFRVFFVAARNLVSIHIGFPARTPVDINLEDIFHNVQWDRLHTLGIQGWRLDSNEIIGILRRHQKVLRDFRMPYVYLREGSRWRDVLSMLHGEMDQLERVDLREIDYASHFDGETMNGIEVPGSPSDTSQEETHSHHDLQAVQQDNLQTCGNGGLSIEELEMLTVESLGDNGVMVERHQWPLWEAWVVSKPQNLSPNHLWAKAYSE